jgi:hypothetical protein
MQANLCAINTQIRNKILLKILNPDEKYKKYIIIEYKCLRCNNIDKMLYTSFTNSNGEKCINCKDSINFKIKNKKKYMFDKIMSSMNTEENNKIIITKDTRSYEFEDINYKVQGQFIFSAVNIARLLLRNRDDGGLIVKQLSKLIGCETYEIAKHLGHISALSRRIPEHQSTKFLNLFKNYKILQSILGSAQFYFKNHINSKENTVKAILNKENMSLAPFIVNNKDMITKFIKESFDKDYAFEFEFKDYQHNVD